MTARWGYWIRRGIGFGVDFTLANTAGELLVNAVLPPVHPAIVASLGIGVVFLYWFVSEWWFGTTLGKRIVDLRVLGLTGAGPSLGGALVRATVIALAFGGDLFELARSLVGPHVPQGLRFVSLGLAAGYAAHAGALALRRRPAPLLHDRMSRTRVVRRRIELPEAAPEAAESGGLAWVATGPTTALWLSLGIVVSIAAGLWAGGGFAWRRLVEPEWRNDQFERAIERLIAREVGIRSQVTSVREPRRTQDAPEAVVGAITITLPWGAYQDQVLQTADVVMHNIRLDPKLFDRVEIVIRSGLSGVLHLDVSSQWTYVADSTKTHFVAAPKTAKGAGP